MNKILDEGIPRCLRSCVNCTHTHTNSGTYKCVLNNKNDVLSLENRPTSFVFLISFQSEMFENGCTKQRLATRHDFIQEDKQFVCTNCTEYVS